MYKETFDAFGRFYEVYEKGNTKYDEKQAWLDLCEAMRKENHKRIEQREKTARYIAERRKDNPNYARPEREHVKR